jgi:glucose-1-phosphate cytidylyltransferase
VLELKPLAKLADDRKLRMFKYDGFWHPMDTLRDKTYLQRLWESGKAPWVVKTK